MAENNEIPEMNLWNKYQHIPKIPQDMGKMQKETEKKKKELDKLKSFILKKYPFYNRETQEKIYLQSIFY